MQITVPKFSLQGLFFVLLPAAYILGKMFYVGDVGGAQPADIAMAVAFLLLITPQALARLAGVNVFLVLLMAWAFIVNIGWAMYSGNAEFVTSASYYVFNLGIVAAVFWTRQRNPRLFDFAVPAVILVAVAVQLVMVTVISASYRTQGTFANPNQLAFWALCVATIWILLRPRRVALLDLGVIGALGWIELLSLSRAGMAGMALLILIWLFRTVRTFRARLIAVGIVLAAGAVLALTPAVSEKLSQAELVSRAEARIKRQQTVSEAEYRGYDRIVEYAGHVVVGAGEGEIERFADRSMEIEIHSTFGTLLFSYGVLGIALFMGFLWRLTRTMALDRYVYILPTLAYGMTHNGLRFSFSWFMVGVMLSFAVTEGRKVAQNARQHPGGHFRKPQFAGARGPAAGL